MSKEFYNKVNSYIKEVDGLRDWWRFSKPITDKFEGIQTTFAKQLKDILLPEVTEAVETSAELNKLTVTLNKDFEEQILAFKTQLLKTQDLASRSIEVLSKPLENEAQEVEAVEIIKQMDATANGLSDFEALNINPTIEEFINLAIQASGLVLTSTQNDFDKIIPNLTKVKDSLETLDIQLEAMKTQSLDRQHSLRFAFSDLNRSLIQLSEDFTKEED